MGEDDTEAQETEFLLATPPRKPGRCVEMSALGHCRHQVAKPICPLCAISTRLPLSAAVYHSRTMQFQHDFRIEQFKIERSGK